MTPKRLQTIKDSLNRRQPDLTVVMEDVRKPHNLAAVARTLEAVGGLQIHAISSLSSIRLSQMAAGGIRKWISVRKYAAIEQGLQQLRQQGHSIIATTLDETSKDFRDIDYTRPTAILVGEELEGISDRAIELADETISIPIVGMVQSLNVSVASALVLYEAYRQREQADMYRQRKLDDATYARLLFEACHPEVARYCRQKSLQYPAIDDDGELLEPVADSTTYSDENYSGWIRKMEI
jgi:tRNA (guanosine-2'-O-)-methyltransferase